MTYVMYKGIMLQRIIKGYFKGPSLVLVDL